MEFKKVYKATRKRFDVGKSCVRFYKLDDLLLEVIAITVSKTGIQAFVKFVERCWSCPQEQDIE
jgi:hypothetical protein